MKTLKRLNMDETLVCADAKGVVTYPEDSEREVYVRHVLPKSSMNVVEIGSHTDAATTAVYLPETATTSAEARPKTSKSKSVKSGQSKKKPCTDVACPYIHGKTTIINSREAINAFSSNTMDVAYLEAAIQTNLEQSLPMFSGVKGVLGKDKYIQSVPSTSKKNQVVYSGSLQDQLAPHKKLNKLKSSQKQFASYNNLTLGSKTSFSSINEIQDPSAKPNKEKISVIKHDGTSDTNFKRSEYGCPSGSGISNQTKRKKDFESCTQVTLNKPLDELLETIHPSFTDSYGVNLQEYYVHCVNKRKYSFCKKVEPSVYSKANLPSRPSRQRGTDQSVYSNVNLPSRPSRQRGTPNMATASSSPCCHNYSMSARKNKLQSRYACPYCQDQKTHRTNRQNQK